MGQTDVFSKCLTEAGQGHIFLKGKAELLQSPLAGHVEHGLCEVLVPNSEQTQLIQLLEVLGKLDGGRSGSLFLRHSELNCERSEAALAGEACVQDVDVGLQTCIQILYYQAPQVL